MGSTKNMTGTVPMLNERILHRHVDAEFDLMKSEIAEVVKEKNTQSQGNSFAQLTHVGATLASRKKVQSIWSHLVDNIFRENHKIYLFYRESKEKM